LSIAKYREQQTMLVWPQTFKRDVAKENLLVCSKAMVKAYITSSTEINEKWNDIRIEGKTHLLDRWSYKYTRRVFKSAGLWYCNKAKKSGHSEIQLLQRYCYYLNFKYFVTKKMIVKGELINMTQAWDKEKR